MKARKSRKNSAPLNATAVGPVVAVRAVSDVPRALVVLNGEVCSRATGKRAVFPTIPDGTPVNLVPHEDLKLTVERSLLGRKVTEHYPALADLMAQLNACLWDMTSSLRPPSPAYAEVDKIASAKYHLNNDKMLKKAIANAKKATQKATKA